MFKRLLIHALSVFLLISSSSVAFAHHGWRWTTGGNIDLIGIIVSAKLGNPHGVVTVDVDGEIWKVEVGQPWRNERAGLVDADFAVGNEMRFIGEPSAEPSQKLMKAERIYVGDREFILYPNRN